MPFIARLACRGSVVQCMVRLRVFSYYCSFCLAVWCWAESTDPVPIVRLYSLIIAQSAGFMLLAIFHGLIKAFIQYLVSGTKNDTQQWDAGSKLDNVRPMLISLHCVCCNYIDCYALASVYMMHAVHCLFNCKLHKLGCSEHNNNNINNLYAFQQRLANYKVRAMTVFAFHADLL